jgi:hypothetical protein
MIDINNYYNSIVQYYEQFQQLPSEQQYLILAGILLAISATRTIWKLLFPIRWIVSKLLKCVAWILHHNHSYDDSRLSKRVTNLEKHTNPTWIKHNAKLFLDK